MTRLSRTRERVSKIAGNMGGSEREQSRRTELIVGPRRLTALALVSTLAALACLALTAAPVLAARTYDSQLTELGGSPYGGPDGVAIDPSSDNVWVTTPGRVLEYSPYPSQTLLGTETEAGTYYGGYYIRGLAVNDLNHRLYVVDAAAGVAYIFDNTGAFNENTGVFSDYVSVSGGSYLNVATDNSSGASGGDIYVTKITESEPPANLVQKFDAAGNPVNFSGSASYISGNQITGTPSGPFSSPNGPALTTGMNVAVDESGNIYVVDPGNSVVDEFDPTGTFIRAFTGAGAPGGFSTHITGVAIDPTSGDLLVVDAGNLVVDEFSPSGEYLEQLTGTGPSQATPFGSNLPEVADVGALPGGIAVNSSGYLYVADSGVVDIFTPRNPVPAVTYEAVANLAHTSATLNASIDLNGGPEVTSCVFQYGTTAAYGTSVPCSPDTPYTGTTPVSADISGLTAETTYHYRVIVTTANGTKRGSDQTFTPRAIYSLTTGSPSNLEPGSGTLNASFTGDGTDTHYYFEYVDFSNYDPTAPDPYSAGQTTAAPPGADAGSATGTQNVSAIANFSIPYFVYHYRIVATNRFGTSYGSDQTLFSPPPALPTIDATSASNVTSVSATLDAQVNPGFGPTIVRFEYGTTTSYGSRTYPTESIGDDDADHPASIDVSGLTPGTTYHFRALATNFSGITKGPDQTLSTPDLPAVVESAATDVTPTTATLSASVRPGFRATTYHFEYGLTDSYGSSTPESASVGTDNSAHPASAAISALTAGTTYHYRIVATNTIGATTGPDQTFTTTPVATPLPPSPLTCKHGFVKRHGNCVKVRHQKSKHVRHERSKKHRAKQHRKGSVHS